MKDTSATPVNITSYSTATALYTVAVIPDSSLVVVEGLGIDELAERHEHKLELVLHGDHPPIEAEFRQSAERSDPELPAVHEQLIVFARELGELYRLERARSAELERVLASLQDTYIATMKSLAQVIEAKDVTSRRMQATTGSGSVNATFQEVLSVPIRKVTIPVAAGRNLAVLVEAAVRNFVLNQRGIDSTKEFIERQQKLMEDGG